MPRPIDANALKTKAYPFPCAIGTELAVPIRAIDEAPTIDPAQHARWILHPEIGPSEADKECSACGAMSLIWSYYCHACGAHMDKEATHEP